METAIESQSQGYESRLSDTLKSLFGVLRRRWLTLVLVTLALFGVATVLIMLMTPKYEATARLQIDPTRNPLQNPNDVQADLASEAIETEVTVLNSQELARDVVQKLQLQNDPEFTHAIKRAPGGIPLTPDQFLNAVVREVQGNLDVRRDKLTYVIDVEFKARDAIKAAKIANTFAEQYIESKVGSRQGTSERQADFFRKQLQDLAAQVNAADAAVAQYRARAGITQGTASGTIADQQVGPLSTQLATAQSDAAEARSNLAAARSQIARGGLDAVSEVRSSPVISDLRRQRAEVLRNVGEIRSRYGDKHPESIKVRDQLAALDAQINAEANRAVGSLQATANAAEARVASLRGTMRGLESEQARNTRAGVIAESLERDAASKRSAYDKMNQLSLASTQGASNEISQATIIDRAVPATIPTAPKRSMLIALALLVALAVGFATIIIQEMLVSGIRSIGDFETQFGIAVLAAVPAVRRMAAPADIVADRPASLFAESLRIARASILGVRSATPPKVIAITSAVPEEGKTTTALAFARVLALHGSRTLIVDCDVRRAALRLVTQANATAGLVEVLQGKAPLEQAIERDRVNNLDVLAVQAPFFSSEDVFGGSRLSDLLVGLRGRYDQVVLDLPPVVGLADARFVAALADAVVLVVKWGSTAGPAVNAALNWLRTDEANVVGAIFTMVDPSAEAIGGLYYSRKYASYYQTA